MGRQNGERLCGSIILCLLLVNVFPAGQVVRADTTLPAVVSVTPSNNSRDVPLKTYPIVIFNKPVNPNTLAGSVDGMPIVPLQAAFDNGNQTLRIDLGDMEYEKKYVVVISGSLEDTSSNKMGNDYTFSFTTIARVSKRPTSTINVPANPQPGETYTLTGKATGYTWQREAGNPLNLTHWDQYGVNTGDRPMLHPTVLYFPNGEDGYKFYLIYTPYPPSLDENPCLMRSKDGIHFTNEGVTNPLFKYGTQPPYDSKNLADPDAIKVGNTWMVFYEMEQDNYGHIGLALSTDGLHYSLYGGSYDPDRPTFPFPTDGNPVIHFSDDTWYEHDADPSDSYPRLGEPAVVFKDNTFHVWYGSYNTGWQAAVYANASDPRGPWTKLGSVLDGVSHPDVVYDPERNLYVMWYGIGSNLIATAPKPWGPWTNHPDNPIFAAQGGWEGEGSNLYRSCLVEVGTQWYLYYSTQGSDGRIGLAREVPGIRRAEISTNGGLTWTQLTTGADGSWSYPWTPTSRQTYSIRVRVTDDWMVGDPAEGIVNVGARPLPSWSKYAGNPILTTSPPETKVGFCSVFPVGNTYHMYYSYTTNNPSDWRIGHATSTDKISWTKDTAHNPVLDSYAYCPIAWKEGSSWNMLYTGYGEDGRGEFYASSTDGLSWTTQNNGKGVLIGTPGQWDSNEGDSDVEGWGLMKIDSTYYLWYGTLMSSQRKTGLATSTDLITWTKDTSNPIFEDASYSYYCASPYYFNDYYYLLMTNPAFGVVLYRDPNPTFYSADRTDLGTVISLGSYESWESLIDTPFILTDDITRVVNPATTIYTYYTGALYSNENYQVGVTVMPSMEKSLPSDYLISASPSALCIPAGSSGSSLIGVASTNEFCYRVSLAASAPSGWSATVNPSSVSVESGGSGSSTLSIAVPSTASSGTYSVTVVSTSGSLSHSTTVTVEAPTGPDYSVSASPSTLSIVAGSSGSSTVTATSLNGFSGTVSLTPSAPSGWSATVYPSSVTVESGGSNSSALSITVPSTTSSKAYAVTVTATNGSLIHSATLTVNVQTVPSPPLSFVAAAGSSQVVLSWSAPSSNGGSAITNYRIYRGGSSEGETLLTTISNLLTYTDEAVTNGQTYFYKVSAVNSVGESDLSNEASATPFTATIGYFGNTNIGSSDDSGTSTYIAGCKYSPTSSGTVTKISLYVRLDTSGHVKAAIYSDANGAPNALLSQSDAVVVGTSFSWVNFTISQAVVGGTNYWLCWIADATFHVKYDTGSTNQEAYSAGITYPAFPSTFPSPSYDNIADSIYATVSYVQVSDYSVSASPSELTIVAGSSGSSTVTVTSLNGFSGTVSLAVSAPSGWGATVTPSSVSVGSEGSESSTVLITVPSSATAGAYTVTVVATSGSLSHSTTVTVNGQTVPSSPQSLVATAGNAKVTLSWSAPSSNGGSAITNYRIYRGGSSGGETLLTTIGNELTYTDTSVMNGQTYYYKVSAVNSIGESVLSNEASATPFVGTVGYFGKTSVGSRSDSTGGSNYVVGCKYTMPESGSITKITAYIQSYDGTPHNGKAALYADNAGVPSAKLVESSEVSISSLGWYDFTVSYTNTQGVRTFWLAITVQGGWRYRYDTGSSNQEAYRPYAYPNFPDPLSPQGYHAFAVSIYATFTQNAYSLTVSVVGSGSVVKVPDQASYHYGDVVQLTANPSAGWSFSAWSGDLSGSVNPTTILIDGNKVVTATFTQNEYSLTINIAGSGTVSKSPDKGTYHLGDVVQLTAVPVTGWAFSGWSGDISGSMNPATIIIDGDKGVTAAFTQNEYTLTVHIVGSGSVTKSPDQATYHYGDLVQLTAVPSLGWSFTGWSGDISGSTNPGTITMTGNKVVTATFTQELYTLTISTDGNGSVSKDPEQVTYTYSTSVQLTASPETGWAFSYWSGDLSGSTNPKTIIITSSMSITAHFSQNQYTLIVNIEGSGSVDKAPNQATYDYGTIVTLTAVATAGWSFSGWSGGLVGNPTSVTITGDLTVTATFTQIEYSLTVNISPVNGGSVSRNPDSPHYHYNDVAQLTATPALGYSFAGWSDGLTGNPTSVTITDNTVVTATFAQLQYMLTINVVGSGSVTQSPDPPYTYGTEVTLTAVPATGWSFSGWSGDVSGSANPETITITGNKAVTATFTQIEYTLDITIVGSGSVSKSPNQATYHLNDVVELTATADPGWSFSGWSGDLSGSTNPTTIAMTGNKAITATFTLHQYTLTINTDGSGSVSKVPDQATYTYGSSVQLTASPEAGWAFSYWDGDLSGSENPATIIMTGNMAITAHFSQNQYTLTINVIGSGSVIKNPNQATYAHGSTVELTANPYTGWSFSGWSGDATGSDNPITITMDGNKAVIATFTQNQYTLTINIVGQGSVSKEPDQATYTYGTTVQLMATPQLGWSFGDWSGDLSGSANPTSITMTGNKAVTATFTQDQYTLSVTVVGSGTVTQDPSQLTYTYGTIVSLTANPTAGWSFNGWNGDLSGNTNPISVTMTGNKTVTATFTEDQYTLTINTVGSGSVSKNPDQATYTYGTSVQLTATPTSGWSFSGWSDDLGGNQSPIDVVMDGNKIVTATFTQNEYTLDVSIVGSGSVTKAPDQLSYHLNDVVQLTAAPNAGWSFSGWNGDLTGSTNPASITIDGNMAVTATFTQNTYSITASVMGVGGTIDPTGVVLVAGGGSQSFAIVADSGYVIADVVVDGVSRGAVSEYTFNAVAMDHSIVASFRLGTYTITASVDGVGGAIDPSGVVSVNGGEDVTFTITPENGYHVLNVMVDGTYMGPQNSFTFYEVDRDHTITAIFAKNEYTLTIIIVGSGRVSTNPNKISYSYGDIVELTATPNNKNWQFAYWSGDLTGNTNPATIIMDGNKTVTATFTRKPK